MPCSPRVFASDEREGIQLVPDYLGFPPGPGSCHRGSFELMTRLSLPPACVLRVRQDLAHFAKEEMLAQEPASLWGPHAPLGAELEPESPSPEHVVSLFSLERCSHGTFVLQRDLYF